MHTPSKLNNGGNLGIKAEPDSDYDAIYRKAVPYLDTRHNNIHISLSFDFASRLLASTVPSR